MSKGTIFYIGSFELPDKNAAAHRVIANGKILRDIGHKVVFIGATKTESHKEAINEKENFFGFDCYKRCKPKSNGEWFQYLINIHVYEEIINKYNDVYAIIGYNLPALVLLNLKRLASKKRIKIFSDCTEWYEIKKKGNPLLKFLIRYSDVYLRMKVINPRLDGVIAISNYLYNYYKNRKVNVVQIPPLVDTNDEKWKNEFRPSSQNIQLLYAGTPFSLYKEPSYKDRLDLIIQALHEIKKEQVFFQMHVIGIEKAEVSENFPQLIPVLDFLDDSLKFYGKLPHLEVIQILKSVDYSLFLRYNSKSVMAGFPTKFVESISCGIPVLSNRNSNIGDYLKEGVTGYWIEIDTLEDMQGSLKKALSIDPAQISQMKKTCYESKPFDYRKYIGLLKAFLNE